MDIRGLTLFISDVRKCANKDKEQQRVDKELAKIRKYFNNPKLKGYDRKKCVCKLLYCYMLGYDLDFGHIEAIRLLASTKYSEKHIGYLACSILLHEKHDMLTLITQRCRADLCQPPVLPAIQSLALTCVGNLGGREMAESLIHDVQKVLISHHTSQLVRKKASLTLLRLYRKYPELLPPDQWSQQVISLLSSNNLGVVTSLMSLLLALAKDHRHAYRNVVGRAIRLLVTIVIQKDYMAKYLYYGSPAPWLQIKLLRILQYYPLPMDSALRQNITTVLDTNIDRAKRLSRLEGRKTSNRYNALHAVFFETLNLAIHYDSSQSMLTEGCTLLLKYVDAAEANLRYLALDTLSRLAYSQFTSVVRVIQRKQHNILICLKDSDISIRRRALDVLYAMCSKANADQIVGELLEYLPLSDYGIREELVLKIAILAEKFAADLTWYVDVILSLIRECGDFVSDDIWFRVCQIITNRQDVKLQKYTAETIFHAVSSPQAHEVCIKVAGYLIGEFGDLISDDIAPSKQFKVLVSKFETGTTKIKIILLNTFVKMYNVYSDPEFEELRRKIRLLFQKYRSNFDIEVQQRSNEYNALIASKSPDLMESVLDEMPPFSSQKNVVVEKLHEKQKDVTNKGLREMKEKKTENDALNTAAKGAKKKVDTSEIVDDDDGEFVSGDEEEESESEEEDTPPPPRKATNDSLIPGLSEDILDMSGTSTTSPPKKTVLFEKEQPSHEVTLDNILNIGGSGPTQPTSQPTNYENPPAINSFFDGPSLQPGVGLPSIGPMVVTQEDGTEYNREVHEMAKGNHIKLLIGKLGVAIEDTYLRVRMKQEYHDARGRLGVYYENKTDSTIDIEVQVDNNVEGLRMEFTKVGSIAPNATVAQYYKIMCVSAFDEKPTIRILYTSTFGKKVKLEIPVPIAIHKFFTPMDVDGRDEFFKLWAAIDKEEPQQIVKVFRVEKGLAILQGLREVVKNGFMLKVYDGIAPNDAINVIGGGKFHSQEGEDAIVLCRVQINAQRKAARMTTKCSNGMVNQVFNDLLHEQVLLI